MFRRCKEPSSYVNSFKGLQFCPIKFFPTFSLVQKSNTFLIFQVNKEEMEAASKEVPYTFKGA